MYEEIIENRYIGAAAIIAINENSRDRFRFVNVNSRYINELGLDVSARDFIEGDYFEFASDADRNDFCRIAMTLVCQNESAECDYRCRCGVREREEIHLTSRIIFIEKSGDDYYFFEEIFNNDRHAGSRKLKEALMEAERANRAKDQFLSNMSHDIRTPMNAIVGFTSLAKLNIDDREKTLEYLDSIENANDFLLKILNDILDITKIESGEITLVEEKIDIRKEIDVINGIYTKLADEKGIVLEHDISGIEDDLVFGDRLRISQILMNIISNAIKYTEKGGRVRYCVVQSDSKKNGCGRYTITVEDNGIGMSREFLGQVFDIFTREKNSTMSRVMGTGLGMAIIKRLVDVMDGEISIESEQGRGTTVVVKLDLRKQKQEDVVSEEKGCKEADDEILKGRRILVVDDQTVNRVIVREMLRKYGVMVDEAGDGNAAIQKIESEAAYDIILMDVQMPVMNGYDATMAIRAMDDKTKAAVPILAMTADAFADDRVKAKDAGMNEHITKPINVNKVVEVLKKYLA